MLNLQDFLRRTPAALLRAYFDTTGLALPAEIAWDAPATALSSTLLDAIDRLDDGRRQRVMDDADRICALAGEDGQAALFDVADDLGALEGMENGHARATWMFVRAPKRWDHAEQVRFADERRFGRMWDGFVGPKGRAVARGGPELDAFREAVGRHFRSANVEVEVCGRSRAVAGGRKVQLVQAAVFLEGLRGDRRAFVDGRLGRVPDRPVLEAAVGYEKARGSVEVVAATRERREALVRMFAEHILGAEVAGERLPLRQYSLDRLRRPFDFPTKAGDGIESVAVTMMRLMPLDAQSERVTLECMRGATRSIWAMAEERFGESNPLLGGHRVTQIRLRIRFAARLGHRGPRTLPVTISMPHGCDLKDRTTGERLIGEKYLPRWGLPRDV